MTAMKERNRIGKSSELIARFLGKETKRSGKANSSFACDVMAALLMYRNKKIFLLWELTSIFMQTM